MSGLVYIKKVWRLLYTRLFFFDVHMCNIYSAMCILSSTMFVYLIDLIESFFDEVFAAVLVLWCRFCQNLPAHVGDLLTYCSDVVFAALKTYCR